MIKAILLAAGQSKRMKSENKLIKLYKNKPLINYSLNVLTKSKVNKIIIVLGHQPVSYTHLTLPTNREV